MKIEKVNDRQIRCTLTKTDLAERELKISELAYGTEKAKSLFRDMMQQAAYQFGIEADDIPLMIEAIPLSGETIVLIITKVENPEELDTRFSKFAPSVGDDNSDLVNALTTSGADDVLDIFRKLRGIASDDSKEQQKTLPLPKKKKRNGRGELQITVPVDIVKCYSFESIDEVSRLARIVSGFYKGLNTLYKSPENSLYYLIIRKAQHTPEDFNKICNIITEYARSEDYKSSDEAYLNEHCEIIISDKALQQMAEA